MTRQDNDQTPLVISSTRNPLVKRIRGLRHREARASEGVVLVEGLRAIIEAVQVGVKIETLLYAPERLRSDLAKATVEQARKRGAQLVLATPEVLDDLSDRDVSQGIFAIAPRPQHIWEEVPLHVAPFVLGIYEPQDPGNVGTITRTSDGAGAAAVITFGAQGADPFDPKAIRASMGSIFSVPVVELGKTELALRALRDRKLRLVGASDKGIIDLWDAPLLEPTVILLGNERAGLPPNVLERCDSVVRIPLAGHADSLNVAAAAAIFAFEAVRQRR
ncbi:MAG: RNA methyltransferase [Ktedonobacterales bacterium]|nr:RNA methyltransferase [Ktedonobacterales bacterium]